MATLSSDLPVVDEPKVINRDLLAWFVLAPFVLLVFFLGTRVPVVPSIRYTEPGTRNVPAHVVESARSISLLHPCTNLVSVLSGRTLPSCHP